MTFVIQDNMQAPASAARTRKPGEFTVALDSLGINQGFEYQSKGTLKGQYPRISKAKFGGTKRFRVWLIEQGAEGEESTYGVRRENDRAVKDAVPGVNTVDGDNDE